MVNVDELLNQVVSLISTDEKTPTGDWQNLLKSMQGEPSKLDKSDKPETTGNTDFQNPLRGTYYCSGIFGVGDDRHKGKHDGVDLRIAGGSPAYPITDGIVTNVGSSPKSGNIIKIKHPNISDNFTTSYMHLGTISVYPGQKVDKNTILGTVGDSGNAVGTYPHIHFETRVNGVPKNPADYIMVPPYTNPNKNESAWLSDEDKNKARSFDVSRHLANQNRTALANKIDNIEKLADMYYNIIKSL
jgi:murein DD-endopeptidase MepM/ murein hydrolase activator NlpD